MSKIDTTGWGKFLVGNLFEKLNLKIRKEDFDKRIDTSLEQDEEFNLPLVNAKDGNNGIMYYGREQDFDTAEMCLDIVQNGAVATGNVYAQIQKTGVLWDAYLIKPKNDKIGEFHLLFLARIMQSMIKKKFCYDNKAIWDKVKEQELLLPTDALGNPDWAYMDAYMQNIYNQAKISLDNLQSVITPPRKTNIIEHVKWNIFTIGDLFQIHKPKVYHTREVREDGEGIPYIVRSKFNNGMRYRVKRSAYIETSPAGVVSFGSENASFFYQQEEWCSGRDIYYIDTRGLRPLACRFLTTCLCKIGEKYSYDFGLFPNLLKKERIMLPTDASGQPDWKRMEQYMQVIHVRVALNLNAIA